MITAPYLTRANSIIVSVNTPARLLSLDFSFYNSTKTVVRYSPFKLSEGRGGSEQESQKIFLRNFLHSIYSKVVYVMESYDK